MSSSYWLVDINTVPDVVSVVAVLAPAQRSEEKRGNSMYLRKNKVRSGAHHRTYLSIAHNAWWPAKNRHAGQSRPVVMACLGPERKVDQALAAELIVALENCVGTQSVERGRGYDTIMRIADEVRKIEAFLRVLVSPKLRLSEHLCEGQQRGRVLEALVRDRLADPSPGIGEDRMFETVRERFGPS
ncbi:MAG: hypothetical protein V3V08_25730 [Nannocystaceae bacterium]